MQGHRSPSENASGPDSRRKPIAGFEGGPGGNAVWLERGRLLSVCPQCHGAVHVPMPKARGRCRRCGATVHLSEAQERQALALLGSAGRLNVTIATGDGVPAQPPSSVPPPEPARPPYMPAWLAAYGRFLLCWLVSVMFHMLLILLLGLCLIDQETRQKIVLAATVGDPIADDGVEQLELPADEPPLEVQPSLAELDPSTEAMTPDKTLIQELTTVDQPTGELLANADLGQLPVGNLSPGQVLAGRDPAFRGQLLAQEGGTSASEAAVARALDWLVRHQGKGGGWSLNHFPEAGDCQGRCGNPGTVESDTAATALGLLPFLGAGETHLRGAHTQVIARGLRALMDMQRPDGDLRGSGGGNMYAHGQATIALCEAFALTQAENLRDPAQRAVDFIVAAQHEAGGWRYRPGEPGDLSVVGWQMMALRSAQMAYLKVPPETFLKATRFLNTVQQKPSLGLYCYMPGHGPSPVMTAEGLLCRQYAGWRHNNPVLVHGVRWLEDNQLPKADRANMYFWYYGTQVMHHMGGKTWETWNDALRDMLVAMQDRTGHASGSWEPMGGHDPAGGRLYTTALAACTLEVYYRHLPLYRGIAASGSEPPRQPRKQ